MRAFVRQPLGSHPVPPLRAAEHGNRVAAMQYTSHELAMPIRARMEQRVTTPCTVGGRRVPRGVSVQPWVYVCAGKAVLTKLLR